MGSLHNTRILRFLLVMTAVALTIFIYASYSTNTALSPLHIRNAGSPSALANEYDRQHIQPDAVGKLQNVSFPGNIKINVGMNKVYNDSLQSAISIDKINKKTLAGANHSHQLVNVKKQHYREPTIDEDAFAMGGNGLDDIPDEVALERLINNDILEEQYPQPFENAVENLNSTGAVQSQSHVAQEDQYKYDHKQTQLADKNLIKILDSEVLIPTSNLQKFIENADKLLTAISPMANKSKTSTVLDPAQKPSEIKFPEESTTLNGEQDINGEVLPPSVVQIIKHSDLDANADKVLLKVNAANKGTSHLPKKLQPISNDYGGLDTTKGIATQRIYESGHMDEEINIEKLCPSKGADLKLLILITSAQSHAEARMAIRQTWGHYGVRRDVSTAFVLGRTSNQTLNIALTRENFIYGDLIRGHFVDSYNNLTLKTISALEWVDKHCSLAKFILKTDDDMFINVPKLLSFLDNHVDAKRKIFGRLAQKWKPIRNKKSKYYVSTGQFKATIFPPFTTGPAYVITSDIIHELYLRSLQQVYLKLEDVFTTGIVAQQLNIKRVHANEFLNRRIAFNTCNIRKTISVHMIKANEQFDLWKKLLDQTTKCK